MTRATATAIFTQLAADANRAPEWVELFPRGPIIKARDGRQWTIEPERVIAAFAANAGPLAIDYEHAQAYLAPEGREAPAAGWIEEVAERDGAVWARVDWVARAARQIVDREYRFLSPDFDHTKDGVILRLNGAGLVNRPALVMTALSRELPEKKELNMSLKAIAAALGLADDADEKAVLAALAASSDERKAICTALKVTEASDSAALQTAIASLQKETETALAAVKVAPNATLVTTLRGDLEETRTALAALQKKDFDREIDMALDAASAEGKVTPASRDSYRAMCADQGGLDRFKALAATLPVICAPTKLSNAQASMSDSAPVDAVALAAKARKYQDDQAALGISVTISDAVAHVEAQTK